MTQTLKISLNSIFIPIGKGIEKRRFSEPPIFIGGCARSGTTLLLSILSAHKDLFCIPNELALFHNHSKDDAGNIIPHRIYKLYRSLFLNRIPKTANRWLEKSPINIQYINEIDKYYQGNFRFIQILRDGRDIILSKHPTARNTYWVSPERWIKDVSAGMEFLNHPKVYSVKYEDLIQNFETTITGICSFLDIELSDEILNWHGHATVTKNRAYYSRVKQISTSSIGKWKETSDKQRVEELSDNPEGRNLLKALGYA